MVSSLPLDFLMRALSVSLLVARHMYWIIAERKSNLEKPLAKKPTAQERLKRAAALSLATLVMVQLLGLDILPFEQLPFVQVVGFLAVSLGCAVCMSARITLGSNWTHGAEYQIKKNQELVVSGIYRYVRHPIYAGIFLSVIGAEMVAGSLMFVVFFILLAFAAPVQAKREEALLLTKFSKDYREYIRKTKRFVSYVW